MEQNAFELIAGRVGEELSESGFAMLQSGDAGTDKPAVFQNENLAYAVIYDRKQKRFELRQTTVTDGNLDDNWKKISVWLFDGENDTLKDAESIANDFTETLSSNKKKQMALAARAKKKEKGDERNVDPFFLIKRFVTIFPDIKFSVQAEKDEYGNVLPVSFVEKVVVPEILLLLEENNDQQRVDRLFEVLNNAYKNGDMDVKSIVTMIILNSLPDGSLTELAESMVSEELLTAWKFGRKMKNKKVKPEKVKKMQKLLAEKSTNSLR